MTAYEVFLNTLIQLCQGCEFHKHWLGNNAEEADTFSNLSQEVGLDTNIASPSQVYEQENRSR